LKKKAMAKAVTVYADSRLDFIEKEQNVLSDIRSQYEFYLPADQARTTE
jgi:hypothetical protein